MPGPIPSGALARNAHLLRCPVCEGALALTVDGDSLGCPSGHRFDIARRGAVTLIDSRANLTTADTADMVHDREQFFDAGHFDAVIDHVGRAVVELLPSSNAVVVDAGAGTGHLLATTLQYASTGDAADDHARACGIALDSSAPAVRMCMRRDKAIVGVVADLWRPWPMRSATADAVLTMFAPRNVAEVERVLRPGGTWWVITPADGHLEELRGRVGLLDIPTNKVEQLADALPATLTIESTTALQTPLTFTRDDIARLVQMGPHRHHVNDEELAERLRGLPDHSDVTQHVNLTRITRSR